MREILFKAKRVKNGEWIEGSLIDLDIDSGYCYIVPPYKQASTLPIGFLITDGMELVIPETLCQFTGLCDKNGNKIWENDIFQYTDETMVNQKDLIEYNETHASFVRLRNTEKLGLRYLWIDEATCNHGEVIGNIFDNPELLQEELDE